MLATYLLSSLHPGVWDDRTAYQPDDFGGHCITVQEAESAVRDRRVEALDISLSNDGNVQGFTDNEDTPAELVIKCLRPRDGYRLRMAPVFHAVCQEEIDAHLMQELAEVSASFLADTSVRSP